MSGRGTLRFQWSHRGEILRDSEETFGSTTPFLFIVNVNVEDFGDYQVRVLNEAGFVDSNRVFLMQGKFGQIYIVPLLHYTIL